MTPTLYDFPASIYCQFVRVALEEKGVEYHKQHVDITMPQQQFDPGYMKLNPRGVVPTLVAGDRAVTDGPTIIRFIDDHFDGPPLTPASSEDRSTMERWIELADAIPFDALLYDARQPGPGAKVLMGRLARLEAIHSDQPSDATTERIEALRALADTVQSSDAVDRIHAELRATLVELDAVLADRDFIAGDSYSCADAVWTPTLGRIEMQKLDALVEGLPNVSAYYERMRSRPSFKASPVVTRMPKFPRPGAN